MTIWLLALILTALACATLYYAGAAPTVNAGATAEVAASAHFRAQLSEIDGDVVAGRLADAEAVAARGELAREILRNESAASAAPAGTGRRYLWVPVALVAAIALGAYAYLGHPEMPAAPLAERSAELAAGANLETAIKRVEARLTDNPSDVRGWQLIAPIYVRLGRYTDAASALRHVIALTLPTADTLTSLGEALTLANGGNASGEPLELFRKAIALDATYVRSRFYVAAEEMRAGDYSAAIVDWTALIALAKGNETWLDAARSGLATAQRGGVAGTTPAPAVDAAQIAAIVDGLAARLGAFGGSLEEWTQLVRSRLVQGRTADAQTAYDAARAAYPDAAARADLDALAGSSGLVLK
ncbi:MAG: c-type cytochrome biogenesis protein CcmI [Devosia sp.]